jgi:hypothetical protein
MGERGVPLVRGVSTEATVAFENVGENVTRISLLELKGYARESWYVAQFRDVPVTSD